MTFLDPMGYVCDLNCVGDYYPLGFPLRLCTNSPAVMSAAAASWASFPPVFNTPALEIQAIVESFPETPPAMPPIYRGREHLWMISGGYDFAVCDHLRGMGVCRLSEATARQTAFAGYYYLEAMAFHLLTQLYLTPVHAACLKKGAAGILLCGESGAGKTSLAYACAKQDWCYVSDNESWLLRDSEDRVALGSPTRIRFRDSAPQLFPELGSLKPFLFANGKMSLALEMNGRPEFATAQRAEISHLVFLNRGGRTGISAVTKDEAYERLLNGVPPYSAPVRQQHEASLRRLVRAETACLSYESLETGVELLGELVAGS